MRMRVVAANGDREVHRWCREILGEVLGRKWVLKVSDSKQELSTADLYIWDHQPGFRPPAACDSAEHFLLADRDSIHPDLSDLRLPNVNIILKPATRAILQSFLEQACGRWMERGSGVSQPAQKLRADRDELFECVIQANLKLQEYDQQRTNFLARAVHDFRTPLTAISGYCGLLLAEQLGSLTEEQAEVLRRMLAGAKRLSRMTNAMFELSTVTRVKNPLTLERHNLADCIEQALHEVSPLMDEKDLAVTVELPPEPLELAFERSQIEQVLINLLDNASKFTPRSGWVRVRGYPFFWERRRSSYSGDCHVTDRRRDGRAAPNSFRIDIMDSGPGIPADQLDKIFEEYTSYGGGADRSGAGLGLAICKMIINAHRGGLWAESTVEGAKFSFVLPFAGADQSEECETAPDTSYCYAGSA
jgi:signal transduction histidine kinase